ncbi:hypothetical protein HK405_002216, partial [Cladochytrium tenue]
TRRGGPRLAHWVVLRSWGCGTGSLIPGDTLDTGWVTANCKARGSMDTTARRSPLANTTLSKAVTIDLSLLPDVDGRLSWSMFSRAAPPFQLASVSAAELAAAIPGVPAQVSGTLVGVQLEAGEYWLLRPPSTQSRLATPLEALMRVCEAVGTRAALTACGYPYMPEGISVSALRDLCQFTASRRSSRSGCLTTLAGIAMTRGKREAVCAFLAASSLVARVGRGAEQERDVAVRPCGPAARFSEPSGGAEGAFLLCSADLDRALRRGALAANTRWLCLPGDRIRLVLLCSAAAGLARCVGTAVFVGSLSNAQEGAGVFIR